MSSSALRSALVPRMPSTSGWSGRSSVRSACSVGSASGTTSTSSPPAASARRSRGSPQNVVAVLARAVVARRRSRARSEQVAARRPGGTARAASRSRSRRARAIAIVASRPSIGPDGRYTVVGRQRRERRRGRLRDRDSARTRTRRGSRCRCRSTSRAARRRRAALCGTRGSGFAPRQVCSVMRRPANGSSVPAITSVPPPRYGDGNTPSQARVRSVVVAADVGEHEHLRRRRGASGRASPASASAPMIASYGARRRRAPTMHVVVGARMQRDHCASRSRARGRSSATARAALRRAAVRSRVDTDGRDVEARIDERDRRQHVEHRGAIGRRRPGAGRPRRHRSCRSTWIGIRIAGEVVGDEAVGDQAAAREPRARDAMRRPGSRPRQLVHRRAAAVDLDAAAGLPAPCGAGSRARACASPSIDRRRDDAGVVLRRRA